MRLGLLGIWSACVVSVCAVGCGDNSGAGGGAVTADTGGAVQIAVVSAPSNLTCLRITVTGNVTSTQFESVTPGASTQFSLSGLPTGAVTVRADGFSAACTAVTMTSIPAWVSNNVAATLVAGTPATIALTMTANGTASVQVNFPTPTPATPPDTTPPTLASFTPVNGANNVSQTGPVVGTFSEPVNLASVTPATFTVSDGSLLAPGNYTTLGNTAAFAPSSPLGPMQTYTARINPGIRDLAGNALASGATWTFRTQDGIWHGDSFVASGSIGSLATASGKGAGGETFAVWIAQGSSGLSGQILASQFSRTTGWSAAQVVATSPAGNSAFSPVLAVDLAGNATVTWTEFVSGASEEVVASHFTAALGWQPAQVLDPDGVNPALAVDPAGNVTAVWISFGQSAVVASQFNGTAWATPQALQSGFNTTAPAVTSDPAGNLTASWGTSTGVWADRFVAGSGWGAAQLIDVSGQSPANPLVAADAAGDVVAVWNEPVGGIFRMMANRFVPATGWGTPQLIDSASTGGSFGPALGVDANGDAIAVFSQNSNLQIVANRFVPTTGWGTGQVLAAVSGGDEVFASAVAVDAQGNAMASWIDFSASGADESAMVDRFTVATGWGVPLSQVGGPGNNAFAATVTVDGVGRITLGALSEPVSVSTSNVVLDRFE